MSSCTECHGAEGNHHTSMNCPRFKRQAMNSQSDNTHQPLDEAELREAVTQAIINDPCIRIGTHYSDGTPIDEETAVDEIMRLFQSQLAAAEDKQYYTGQKNILKFMIANYPTEADWIRAILNSVNHKLQSQANTNQSHERGDVDG